MDLRRFCTEIGLPFGAVRIVEKMNEEISEVCYQYVRELVFYRQRGNFPGDRISCRIQTEISLLLLQTCM